MYFAGKMNRTLTIKRIPTCWISGAEKLGFKTIFVSKNNKIGLKNSKISIELVSKIEDVASRLFD
jgi:hypothetical protein